MKKLLLLLGSFLLSLTTYAAMNISKIDPALLVHRYEQSGTPVNGIR